MQSGATSGKGPCASRGCSPEGRSHPVFHTNISAVYGVLGPAKLPKPVVAKLNATILEILNERDFVEKKFAAQGMVPMRLAPEQFARYIQDQTQQTRRIVALAGLKVE